MIEGGSKLIRLTKRRLGEGGQAIVYLAVDEEGKEYAIKIFDLSK